MARKILLISEVFPPQTGGSARWFWEIYRRLPQDQVVVAAGEYPGHAAFDQTHEVHVVRMPLDFPGWGVASVPGTWRYARAAWRLRTLAARQRVQMVHCGRCLPEGWLAWILKRWRGLPYVCYVHGEEMNYATTSRELGWLTRRVLRSAKFVIANSWNTERILREDWHLPADRTRVLHPGVDAGRFVPALPDRGTRAKLGWNDFPVVLTVGRLQKRKGHDQMILALRSIRQKVPDICYAIVGDGEERGFLQDLARREGVDEHVQFLGELHDDRLLACYQQCDLFVLPNRQVGKDIEGFGIVLLEAQACGKPVLAGASGGTAETMAIPETGLVVPCEGPQRLAAAVIELLLDPQRRRRMGVAARQWVVERFDWTALSSQAAQLFRDGPEAVGFSPAVKAVSGVGS